MAQSKPRKRRKPQALSDTHRDEAWKHIKSAAREHGVKLEGKDWRDFGPSTDGKGPKKKRAAR